MVVNMASSRRKSIAVTQEGRSRAPKKKRAHSLGASKLSPASRSRLSLGPVKGILKARPSIATSSSSSQPTSSQSGPSSQSFLNDESNATQSMDMTQDYQAPIHDNYTRKSFGRRVSFNNSCAVRIFERANKDDTTSSQGSQSSSNGRSPDDNPRPATPAVVNDENAYPGAKRRRSSVRKSMAGSEDMDLTSNSVGAFLLDGEDESVLLEEEMDLDEGSDMDVTQAYSKNMMRRRSSVGTSRAPLTQISSNPIPSDEQEHTESFTSDQSYTSDGDTQQMDITVPLDQPLRPAHQNEAWLALVRATHSGDASIAESSDMEDASFVHGGDLGINEGLHLPQPENDSMSMSEDSLGDVGDDGNQTMNLSKIMGRVSFGGGMGRPSTTSAMDESIVYGSIVPSIPATSTPRASLAPHPPVISYPEPPSAPPDKPQTRLPFASKVFSAPPAQAQTSQSTSTSAPAPSPAFAHSPVFKPPPRTSPSKHQASASAKSPSKPVSKQFSAAFAPPVSRPTPKKSTESNVGGPSQSAASKRERTISGPSGEDARPSPAKRQALGAKWSEKTMSPTVVEPSPASTTKPRPLSSSKTLPFHAQPAKPSTSIRRPSGYFARRKSLGAGLGVAAPSTAQEQDAASDDHTPAAVRTSPKKKAGLGLGRVSMGSAPSDAWTRFDKSGVPPFDNGKGKGKALGLEVDLTPVEGETEAEPTVGGSSSNLPPMSQSRADPPAPTPPVVDLSAILETGAEEEDEGEEEPEAPQGMDLVATQQWRDEVPEDGYEADEGPPISIEQFFLMTDIKFMELSAPRRSMHPSQLPPRQARNTADIPLSEYAVAMAVDVPQLVLYSRVSRDLEAWVEQSKVVFEQAEEEAAKMTPELFTEYSRADAEGQTELLHQLRLIRNNTRLLAKSDWYKWKLQWIDGLNHTAQKAFADLQNDAKALETLRTKADEIVPELQREYDEVLRELENERREVAEIEESDPEYLNELKNSIAEQNAEIETYKAEVKEGNDQLQWLQERLDNVRLQKRENSAAIEEANRILHLQTNSTRAEVFRLKSELEALEDLYMFHLKKVNAETFEYVYASEYHVVIPCDDYAPITTEIRISRLPEIRTQYKEEFLGLDGFLLSAAQQYMRTSKASTTRQIVQGLADFFTSTTAVRVQLRHLSIRYPVEIKPAQTPEKPFSEFRARAMVLFPAKKAKAYVSYVFNSDTFGRWPHSIASLRWEVKVAYGPVDQQIIFDALSRRMSSVTPSENYVSLLDACIEAQDEYA